MSILCTCTNTHRENLLSALYWCLIQWTIVFRVLVLFFFLTMLKYLNCIDCWLSLKKQNYLSCMTEVDIVQGWDKAFFNPFLYTTYQFWCRNMRFSYLFHISQLLFTAWAQSPAAPSGWIQSNDTLWRLTIWRAWEVFRWWFRWASLQPEIKFCDKCKHRFVFWPDIWICPISWLISLCSVGTYKNPEFYFLGKYCNSGLMSSSETFRARSNFVPFLQCEKSE